MATHLAPHLTATGTEWRFLPSQVHLLVVAMAFILSMAQSLELEDRKCNRTRDCAFSQGETCDNKICRCQPPTCNQMLALPIKCTEDVDCAQFISFSHCMHQSCICLPGYKPALAFGRACELITEPETTSPSSSWPVRPPYRSAGETDYSGVVKMALGAAIVMLAGVILALVWNLYRERRRARRALAGQNTSTRNRRPPRTNRRPLRMRGSQTPNDGPDHPPRYDDVFYITTTEPGRRHEKPPSYEEALRDQQIPIVTPPAYLNLGFNSDVQCAAGYYQPVATVTPTQEQVSIENSANSSEPTRSNSDAHILNVTSIINRLRFNRQPTNGAANNSGVSDDSSVPTCTLRRTKSGRAPDDICPEQCENLVDQVSVQPSNSNPIPTVRIDQSSNEQLDSVHIISDTSINNDSSPGITLDSELDSVTAHYKQDQDDQTSANLTVLIEQQHVSETNS